MLACTPGPDTGHATSARQFARAVVLDLLSRRTRAELAYALTDLPAAAAEFAFAGAALSVAWFLALATGGLPVTVTLSGARLFAAAERCRARTLLRLQLSAPPPLPRREPGYLGWVKPASQDMAGWRIVVYLLTHLPLSVLSFTVCVAFWACGVFLILYPLLWWTVPAGYTGGSAAVIGVIGVAVLMSAPWAVRGVLAASRLQLCALLGQDESAQRARYLEQARGQLVEDSAARLRRIERDLHDGAQARLVAMTMRLSVLHERLASAAGPGADDTRDLVEAVRREAGQAMSELRDLAHGIRPPVLDSGLDAALETLAAHSAVPVDVRVGVAERPSAGIETMAYFCAAELLSNVGKHSAARQAALDLSQQNGTLLLRVADDGVGGARPGTGTGLADLGVQVQSVDGALSVDSPPGGPTLVTVALPLRP